MDFVSLLSEIIPIAMVAAISPTSMALVIVLLSLSKRPRTGGLGFLTGAFIVVFLAALLGILASDSAFQITQTEPGVLKSYLDLIIGLIVLFYGIKILIKKQSLLNENRLHTFENRSSSSEFYNNMILAMGIFSLNFITTLLVFLAGSKIALSQVSLLEYIIALFVLLAITLSLVAIPVLIYFVVPQKADKILIKLNKWINKNSHYLTAILVIIIGLYLFFNGLTELNLI